MYLYFKEEHKEDIEFVRDIKYSLKKVYWFLKHYLSLNNDVVQPNICELIVQMNNNVILSSTLSIEPFYQLLEEKSSDNLS